MFDSIKKLFGGPSVDAFAPKIAEINALEPEISALGDDELKAESEALKARVAPREGGEPAESLDDILPRAFALAREAARRTLGQRPFDVQLMGGMALHKGSVAEMMTGEGKTLSGVAP